MIFAPKKQISIQLITGMEIGKALSFIYEMSEVTLPTDMGFMIWWAMYGSGVLIGMMRTFTKEAPNTIPRGPITAICGYYVAAHGITFLVSYGVLSGTGTTQMIGTMMLVFVVSRTRIKIKKSVKRRL
jgi:hypothetical protein